MVKFDLIQTSARGEGGLEMDAVYRIMRPSASTLKETEHGKASTGSATQAPEA